VDLYPDPIVSNKNPDPHPDTHQSDKLDTEQDPISINLQMTGENLWNMTLFYHFFKGLSLNLEAGIGSGSTSGCKVVSASGSASNKNQNPDTHPDHHQGVADPQHCPVVCPRHLSPDPGTSSTVHDTRRVVSSAG
jgi:hypothetical protein